MEQIPLVLQKQRLEAKRGDGVFRQCCVCGRFYKEGKWVEKEDFGIEIELITHSYCDVCLKKELEKMKRFFEDKNDV
jgi:hypothetical protein